MSKIVSFKEKSKKDKLINNKNKIGKKRSIRKDKNKNSKDASLDMDIYQNSEYAPNYDLISESEEKGGQKVNYVITDAEKDIIVENKNRYSKDIKKLENTLRDNLAILRESREIYDSELRLKIEKKILKILNRFCFSGNKYYGNPIIIKFYNYTEFAISYDILNEFIKKNLIKRFQLSNSHVRYQIEVFL
jgi:hypothetical protein